MAWNKLSSYRTSIESDYDHPLIVRYHKTAIVKRDNAGVITLNSGGWRTVTTKRKMNQASHQFGLGYGVFQKDFDWYVDFNGATVEFEDGMELKP